MSRSIHETRRQWRELRRAQFSDPQEKRRALRSVARRVLTKRDIKHLVQVERRDAGLSLLPSLTDLIPIRVLECGPYIHHPAGETDLRNIMRALPKGVLDGLSGIELRLEASSQTPKDEPDPLTARIGFEMLPGIFSSRVVGVYNHDGKIVLSSYVYDPGIPNRDALELYLRLQMLSTFVHEVAHRFDQTSRVARGRWRMDDTQKIEAYAEYFEREWTQAIVVPYLERAYPHQFESLQIWVETHGGAQVGLLDLLEYGRSGSRELADFFNPRAAFENLIENVAQGLPVDQTRIDYARDLHYAEVYDLALESLESVLLVSPDNLEALVLQADIYVHQQKFKAAHHVVERVLDANAIHLKALGVMCDALEGMRDWATLRTISLRLCRLENTRVYEYRNALLTLAKSNLELGNLEFMRENLNELNALEPAPQKTHAWDKLAWLNAELSRRTRTDRRRLKP